MQSTITSTMNCWRDQVLPCAILMTLFPLLMGCNDNVVSETSDGPPARKYDFHRPKDFSAAVQRLESIHAALVSETPIPEPRKIEFVEVIHGEGPSAHSHFYSADRFKSGELDEDHHAETMKEEIISHEYTVGIFTEMQDIAGWLPTILASADVAEDEWEMAKKISADLEKRLAESFNNRSTDASRRDHYQSRQTDLADAIEQLKKIEQSTRSSE